MICLGSSLPETLFPVLAGALLAADGTPGKQASEPAPATGDTFACLLNEALPAELQKPAGGASDPELPADALKGEPPKAKAEEDKPASKDTAGFVAPCLVPAPTAPPPAPPLVFSLFPNGVPDSVPNGAPEVAPEEAPVVPASRATLDPQPPAATMRALPAAVHPNGAVQLLDASPVTRPVSPKSEQPDQLLATEWQPKTSKREQSSPPATGPMGARTLEARPLPEAAGTVPVELAAETPPPQLGPVEKPGALTEAPNPPEPAPPTRQTNRSGAELAFAARIVESARPERVAPVAAASPQDGSTDEAPARQAVPVLRQSPPAAPAQPAVARAAGERIVPAPVLGTATEDGPTPASPQDGSTDEAPARQAVPVLRQSPPAAPAQPAVARAAGERIVPAPVLGTATEDGPTPASPDPPLEQTSKDPRVLSGKPSQPGDAPHDQPARLQAAMPDRSNLQPALPQPPAGGPAFRGAPAPASPRQPLPTMAQALTPAGSPAAPPASKSSGEVRLRLPDAGRESNVEVRVKEQTGELRVAVRTSDTELAQSLREKLPELVDRLGQKGFETQVWRPAGADAHPRTEWRGLVPRETDLSGGTRDQGSSGQGQAGSEEHRQSEEDHSSGWIEEWEKSFGPPADQTDRSGSRWLQP